MTTHDLMPHTLAHGPSHHHYHAPGYLQRSMHEQESAWYLPAFNESSSSSTSWMEHDPTPANYTHTPATTAASYSNPAWAVSHHGSQAGEFDANSNPDWCAGVASTSTNAYLTPASSVVDFGQQRSHQSNLPSYLDQHEHTRSMTHSPSMKTYVSTPSETGSVYADGTPPPAPPAFYQRFAEDAVQAAILSAIPEQAQAQPQSQLSKQDSMPANPRRSTGISKAGAKNIGGVDSKEAADKARERRSGHSAVERKYRENLNGKIEVLRQVLVEAHRNYDQAAMSCAGSSSSQQHASDMSMTHTARHAANASKEGHPPPHSVITFAATIGSKKSDVLSTAIHYIKEAEQSRGVLLQQVAFLQNQIVKLEGMLCGGASDCSSAHGNSNGGSGGGSVGVPPASQAVGGGGSGSGNMQQHHSVKGRMMR